MITKLFDSGISNGESPVNYLLGDIDHAGQIRSVKPKLILGDPQTTVSLINSIDRKFKYTSGVLSFRFEEKPTKKQMLEIIKDFRKSLLPGLIPNKNYNDMWVLHKDKGFYEMHFLVVCEELTSNKRLNIAPPGKICAEHFKLWSNSINQKNGWFQVITDPFKVQLTGFEFKGVNGNNNKESKFYFADNIKNLILNEKIQNRDHLIQFLEDNQCQITRAGENFISIIFPGSSKAKKFKGGMFSANADYKDLIAQHHESMIPRMLTPEEELSNNSKLLGHINNRLSFNTKAYLTPKKSFRRPRSANPVKHIKKSKEQPNTFKELPEKLLSNPEQEKNMNANALINNIKEIRNKAQSGTSSSAISNFINVVGIMIQLGSVQGQLNNLNAKIAKELDPVKSAELKAKAMELELQLQKLNRDLIDARNKEHQKNLKSKN